MKEKANLVKAYCWHVDICSTDNIPIAVIAKRNPNIVSHSCSSKCGKLNSLIYSSSLNWLSVTSVSHSTFYLPQPFPKIDNLKRYFLLVSTKLPSYQGWWLNMNTPTSLFWSQCNRSRHPPPHLKVVSGWPRLPAGWSRWETCWTNSRHCCTPWKAGSQS